VDDEAVLSSRSQESAKSRPIRSATVAVIALAFVGTVVCHAHAFDSQESLRPSPNEPEMGIMVGANEMVMPPMSQITATTKVGTITITAGEGFRRCYSWDHATGCLNLEPRNERWYGSLGAYSDGFLQFWRNYNGIDRAVTDEGQHHFSTVEEFQNWLTTYFGTVVINFVSPVYRDDGLLVGWQNGSGIGGLGQGPKLNVDVEQIYIGGKKPTKLPGSQNDKIVVRTVQELPKDNMRKTFLLF
jgi:hypothetical protein